jgi:hypothetical protein
LGVLVLALAFAGTAVAASTDLRANGLLSKPASFVAGKPVTVTCPTDLASWEREKTTLGLSGLNVWGMHDLTTDAVYIHPNGCRILSLETRGKDVSAEPALLRAGFVETLVHEAIHARQPSASEGVVECAAMHETPRVMVKFFHVKPGKQLRAWMAAAWFVHRSEPAAYKTVC